MQLLIKSGYYIVLNSSIPSFFLGADKDGAKVEDANGEFSHEMQIKAAGNEYTVDNSNWVSCQSHCAKVQKYNRAK